MANPVPAVDLNLPVATFLTTYADELVKKIDDDPALPSELDRHCGEIWGDWHDDVAIMLNRHFTGAESTKKMVFGDHWDANSKRLTDLAQPVDLQDAATKSYVDGIAPGAGTLQQAYGATADGKITTDGVRGAVKIEAHGPYVSNLEGYNDTPTLGWLLRADGLFEHRGLSVQNTVYGTAPDSSRVAAQFEGQTVSTSTINLISLSLLNRQTITINARIQAQKVGGTHNTGAAYDVTVSAQRDDTGTISVSEIDYNHAHIFEPSPGDVSGLTLEFVVGSGTVQIRATGESGETHNWAATASWQIAKAPDDE